MATALRSTKHVVLELSTGQWDRRGAGDVGEFAVLVRGLDGHRHPSLVSLVRRNVMLCSHKSIVSSLSTRTDTQVLSIDVQTGDLRHTGMRGVDVFASETEAIASLTQSASVSRSVRGAALIGYLVAGSTAWIILATKVRADMQLFAGHQAYTLDEVQWIRISLTAPILHQDAKEMENLQALTEFPLADFHWYCDSLDMTVPFQQVATHAPREYDATFCWNDWLSAAFAALGMRRWCVVLIQGLARSRTVQLPGASDPLTIGLVTRKSCLNPGTRYLARGLNEVGEAGNEMECELILLHGRGTDFRWCAYTLRRGTVPLWWRQELRGAVGEADIMIRSNPYAGIERYYTRLLQRYGEGVPITCVNLLKARMGSHETVLSEHFQDSIRHLRRTFSMNVSVLNFDWHKNMAELGQEHSVAGLWARTGPALHDHGFSHGTVSLSVAEADQRRHVTPGGYHTLFSVSRSQRGVLRLNCADSLDRTNLAAFFFCWQVLTEMCRVIGCVLPGMRAFPCDGTTQWPYYPLTYEQMQMLLGTQVLQALAECFVVNGDVCSMLYTASPATHTGTLRLFSDKLTRPRHDVLISIQRRLNNILNDQHRHGMFEMLLGLGRERHFPSLFFARPVLVSCEPATMLKRVPIQAIAPVPLDQVSADVLLRDRAVCWVLPPGVDHVELVVWLREPCRVTDIALTVRRSFPGACYPLLMDVRTGPTLDQTVVQLQNVRLPRCADGTRLWYALPTSDAKQVLPLAESLYPYRMDPASAATPHADLLHRVVVITLHGITPASGDSPAPVLTLGHVAAFGVPARVDRSPDTALLAVHTADALRDVSDIVSGIAVDAVAPTVTQTPEIEPLDADALTAPPQSPPDGAALIAAASASAAAAETDAAGSASTPPHQLGVDVAPVSLPSLQPGTGHTTPVQLSPRGGSGDAPSAAMGTAVAGDVNLTPDLTRVDVSVPSRAFATLVKMRLRAASSAMRSDPRATRPAGSTGAGYAAAQGGGRHSTTDHALQLTLNDALELELCRLRLRLTCGARDAILSKLGLMRVDFDPNRFVFPRNERVLEEIMRSSRFKTKRCGAPGCDASLGGLQMLVRHQCWYCFLRVCSNCIAAEPRPILEYCWAKPRPVCRVCAGMLDRQHVLVAAVRQALSLIPGSAAILAAAEDAAAHLTDVMRAAAVGAIDDVTDAPSENPRLATLPLAGLLLAVPCAVDSPPAASLLLPLSVKPLEHYWRAPSDARSVDVTVALAASATLHRVRLVVDADGWGHADAPTVCVTAGHLIGHITASLGMWDMRSSLNSETGRVAGCTSLELTLPTPMHARLITFTLALHADAPSDAVLHLGRIQVHGQVVESTPIPIATSQQLTATAQACEQAMPITPRVLRTKQTDVRDEKRTLELTVDPCRLVGFSMTLRDRSVLGDASTSSRAVRRFRVSVVVAGQTGAAVSLADVGEYTLPRVSTSATLSYAFPQPVLANKVVFHALTTYGVGDVAWGRVTLSGAVATPAPGASAPSSPK